MKLPFPTFCITLPETPERTEKARQHFKSVGLDVHFFDGIHAQNFGLKTEFTYDVDNPGTGYSIGYKPTGIWLSHWALWSALNMRPEQYFFVLEVDAQFPADWYERFCASWSNTPSNMDMLYVGSCCCARKPVIKIRGDVHEVHYPMCTHAYVVAKKAISTILKTQRKIYAPIDISLAVHTLPLLRTYTVLPSICTQFDTVIEP